MSEIKCYLAAPFFDAEQIALVEMLEAAIEEAGYRMFSPRKASNAMEMNSILKSGGKPSNELRGRVFNDNCKNVDDSDLMIAVIDNFDVGVMFEVGFAFARHVPIVTHTAKNYGCNLMLAHSIIGHTKTIDDVKDVLSISNPALKCGRSVTEYGQAIASIQAAYKSDFSLKEGRDERAQ